MPFITVCARCGTYVEIDVPQQGAVTMLVGAMTFHWSCHAMLRRQGDFHWNGCRWVHQ